MADRTEHREDFISRAFTSVATIGMAVAAVGMLLLAIPSVGLADDDEEWRAIREERLRVESDRRAEERARRDRERRAEKNLRNLRRKLDKAKSAERRSQYGHRWGHGSNDGQAGAHCMYGADDKLIYAPRGARCAAVKGGPLGGPSVPAVAAGCTSGDCRDGEGVYVWSNGARYQGGFKNGLQHGQGSIAFPNGASYIGAWDQGRRHGIGTAIFPDGRVQAGRWAENRYLGEPGSGGLATAKIDWPDLSRPAPAVGGGEHDVAILVGIQDYAHVAKVPGAEQNAIDWYRYLVKTRGIPNDRVTLLLDEDATREEIRYAAEDAARRVGKKGHLWFVFIGHGAPAPSGDDGLLIGFDAQQKARSLTSRGLERSELLEILEGSKAKHIHVLLDACFSGRSSSGDQLVAGLQPLVVTSTAPTSDRRTTLMTAAASDQFAGPLPGARRPAFSYLLLGGLRGWADEDGDGRVSSGELHRYATKTMRSMIRGRSQTPTLDGRDDIRLGRSAREKGPDVSDLLLGDQSAAAPR